MTSIQLKKFDLSRISDDRFVLILAKRNCGKTTLCTDIMYHKRHINKGIVISGTEDSNQYWGQYVPDLFIWDSYSPEMMESIIENQKRALRDGNGTSMFIVAEDIFFDRSIGRDRTFRYLAQNGRHLKLFMVMNCQYCLDIGPSMRAQLDYIFILKENNIAIRKNIYTQYAGFFESYDVFSQVFDQVTDGYGCMVIDNTSRSNQLNENVYWYQAEIRPPFRIGPVEFWRYHIINRRDDDERAAAAAPSRTNPIQSLRKKKGTLVKVDRV